MHIQAQAHCFDFLLVTIQVHAILHGSPTCLPPAWVVISRICLPYTSAFFKDLGLNFNNRSVRCPGVGFEEMETLIIGLDRFWLHFCLANKLINRLTGMA